MTGRRSSLANAAFLRFLVVGLSNTAISYVGFALAVRLLPDTRAGTFSAQAISYTCGIFWSYVWNRRWSFRSAGSVGSEAVRFLLSQLALLLLTSASIAALVHSAGMRPSLSWLMVMSLATVANYLVLRAWVFGGAEAGDPERG